MGSDALKLGTAIESLLSPDGEGLQPMPLVPFSPRHGPQLDALRDQSTEELFNGNRIRSRHDAECVRSGLFLYFSALDESHAISQRISTDSGSYWHGIMHRQEGDWGNAKYWFRRIGRHPVFAELGRLTGKPWDPFAFVDRCSAADAGRGDSESAIDQQMLEWRLLMRHCYRKTLGR